VAKKASNTPIERQYIVLSRAWYSSANLVSRQDGVVDEITVMRNDGARTMEVLFRLFELAEREAGVAFVLYAGSWPLLTLEGELFRTIARVGSDLARAGKSLSLVQIETVLKHVGFRDITPTQRPPASPDQPRRYRSDKGTDIGLCAIDFARLPPSVQAASQDLGPSPVGCELCRQLADFAGVTI
jgi:hypothetical protein